MAVEQFREKYLKYDDTDGPAGRGSALCSNRWCLPPSCLRRRQRGLAAYHTLVSFRQVHVITYFFLTSPPRRECNTQYDIHNTMYRKEVIHGPVKKRFIRVAAIQSGPHWRRDRPDTSQKLFPPHGGKSANDVCM